MWRRTVLIAAVAVLTMLALHGWGGEPAAEKETASSPASEPATTAAAPPHGTPAVGTAAAGETVWTPAKGRPGRGRVAERQPALPGRQPVEPGHLQGAGRPQLATRSSPRIGLDKPLHPDFGTQVRHPVRGGGRQAAARAGRVRVQGRERRRPVPDPADAPIEGGPDAKGDRHVLVLDRDNWKLYELYAAYPQDGGKSWKAGSGAIFDLKSNKLRPAGWTCADAAGLPILPGLVRYDEVGQQKEITHALRFTCVQDPPGVRRRRPRTSPAAAPTRTCRRWACACG